MQRLLMWTILWCTLNLRLIGHPQYCPPFVSPPMSYYGAPNFLPFKSVHMLWTIFLTLNYTIVLDLSLILKLYEYDCVTRMVIDHENYVRLMSNLMITRIDSVWQSLARMIVDKKTPTNWWDRVGSLMEMNIHTSKMLFG